MASNVKDVLRAPIIQFDSIDSTNNRAAQLIDADKAVEGLTLVSKAQTQGKGQRGRLWQDEPGAALLMSIVLAPKLPLDEQFSFSATVAVAVAEVLQTFCKNATWRIKFPNDIIVNDKKAGGILIENSLRGSVWTHAIVGLGINVKQKSFSEDLPHAGALAMFCGNAAPEPEDLLHPLREEIIKRCQAIDPETAMSAYNQMLYKRGEDQFFKIDSEIVRAEILGVNRKGNLLLRKDDGTEAEYPHGSFEWFW